LLSKALLLDQASGVPIVGTEARSAGTLTLPLAAAFSGGLDSVDTTDDVGDIRSHGQRRGRLAVPFRPRWCLTLGRLRTLPEAPAFDLHRR
jgi:hypothetical protein